MKIIIIHGQNHKGNTWQLSRLFLRQFQDGETSVTEFHLPESAPAYCTGCGNCIFKGEQHCPHAAVMQPVISALGEADLIVFASPCYVLNMTGQLKALFDHLAYLHMAHRPEASMFRKQALIISTAAGMGMGKTAKAIADNPFQWGAAKIYRYGLRIGAKDFESIPAKRKAKIEGRVRRIARKIEKNSRNVKAGIKTKLMFSFMRIGQLHNDWNSIDKDYWEKQGWLAGKRPY